MENVKVSIIIPVYNGEKTIEECLLSVFSQSYKNYEIIILDNNSTDRTKEIILALAKNNKKIKYVFEPKIGRGAARNAGIKTAGGYIIAMTDADCKVAHNWLEDLAKPIIKDNEKIVMGSQKDAICNFWTKSMQKMEQKTRLTEIKDDYIDRIDTKNFAIESDLMKKFMFDDSLVFCEDTDLYLRIKMKDFKIKYLESVRVFHRHQPSFLSLIKREFNRGYWTAKIYKKYKKNPSLTNLPALKFVSVKSFITAPLSMLINVSQKTPLEYLFFVVSAMSWKAGALREWLKF